MRQWLMAAFLAGMLGSASGQGVPPLFPGQTMPGSVNQGVRIIHPSPSGAAPGPTVLNEIDIGTTIPDQVNGGANFINGFQVDHFYGGGSTSGGRETIAAYGYLVGPTLPDNQNRNYVGISTSMAALSDDGGTQQGPKGAIFSFGGQGILCGTAVSGMCNGHPATNMLEVTWAEGDVSARAGSSVYYKNALSLAGQSDDAVQGWAFDGELSLSNEAGAVGFKNGILFSDANGQQPVATNGCAICSQDAGQIWSLLDFSSYTINGWYFNLQGYQLDNFADDIGTEYGSQSAATFPYFDWHSSGGSNDYDFRIQATGGTAGETGQGALIMTGGFLQLSLAQGLAMNGQAGWTGTCSPPHSTVVSHGIVTGCQ